MTKILKQICGLNSTTLFLFKSILVKFLELIPFLKVMTKKPLSFWNILSLVSHSTSLTILFCLPCRPLLIFGMDTSMSRGPRTPPSGPLLSHPLRSLGDSIQLYPMSSICWSELPYRDHGGRLLIMQSWFIKSAKQGRVSPWQSLRGVSKGGHREGHLQDLKSWSLSYGTFKMEASKCVWARIGQNRVNCSWNSSLSERPSLIIFYEIEQLYSNFLFTQTALWFIALFLTWHILYRFTFYCWAPSTATWSSTRAWFSPVWPTARSLALRTKPDKYSMHTCGINE